MVAGPAALVAAGRTKQLGHRAAGTEDTHEATLRPASSTRSRRPPGLQSLRQASQNEAGAFTAPGQIRPLQGASGQHSPATLPEEQLSPSTWKERRKGGGRPHSRNSVLENLMGVVPFPRKAHPAGPCPCFYR